MTRSVIDADFWRGRRVLVTGHTGFKGSWLSLWLASLGAKVFGVALAPTTQPNLFEIADIRSHAESVYADINHRAELDRIVKSFRPEIVFHLAAQPLVRHSYEQPIETFMTNVVGIVTLLDVLRSSPDARAAVIITSDKCYDNREWIWGYREEDRLGGRDPYSASKGCAEIVAASMQASFFAPYVKTGHPARIATVRAGNVIGGGDWAVDRLIPDIVRGCFGADGTVILRNPSSIRPWQHVLEPLCGYLEIAQRLVLAPDGFDEAWNFGPEVMDSLSVREIAQALITAFGSGRIVEMPANDLHEAKVLRLDCTKAKLRLEWKPRLSIDQAIAQTAAWYQAWRQGKSMAEFTVAQIKDYMRLAIAQS